VLLAEERPIADPVEEELEQRLYIPNQLLMDEVAEAFSQGKRVTVRATGMSMLPFIIGGRDDVVIAPVRWREDPVHAGSASDGEVLHVPVKGDIALARLPGGRYVLHRVIAAGKETCTLMGDGNLRRTETCMTADIIGTAIGVERDGRYIDLCSGVSLRRARIWQRLLPVRRCLLWFWKRVCLKGNDCR